MLRVVKPTFLTDEQGKLSLSRILLLAQLVYVDVSSAVAAFTLSVVLTGEWWVYQSTLTVGLIAWAAGPRGLQYIGPVLGQITGGMANAVGRLSQTDNRFKDDERGA